MQCVACEQETESEPCSACGGEPRVGGRYALIERVGGGASGVVFRALDSQTGAEVAVKAVMLGGLDGEKARELAQREAQVLRQLSHPGIPAWRDEVSLGIGRSAALYLVQDFVAGVNLQAELVERRWSEREVLELMLQVLPILEYLHGRHPAVVHRDVKPSNLIRGPDGSVSLVDFGAVRDAMRTSGMGEHTVAGTFGYMAPEQFAGHAEPRSDLYALGMTAVALLSRRPVAELHDRLGQLHWESVVSVSAPTTALLRALLRHDPHDRPASAAEVRRRVLAVLTSDAPDGNDGLQPEAAAHAQAAPAALSDEHAEDRVRPVRERERLGVEPELGSHDLVAASAERSAPVPTESQRQRGKWYWVVLVVVLLPVVLISLTFLWSIFEWLFFTPLPFVYE